MVYIRELYGETDFQREESLKRTFKSGGEKIYIANGVYGRHDILMLIFLCVAVIQ